MLYFEDGTDTYCATKGEREIDNSKKLFQWSWWNGFGND